MVLGIIRKQFQGLLLSITVVVAVSARGGGRQQPTTAFLSILQRSSSHSSLASHHRGNRRIGTHAHAHTYGPSHSYRGGATILLHSSSSPNDATPRTTEGRTGWSHNQPTKKSDFWKDSTTNGEDTTSSATDSSSSSSDSSSISNAPLKTGWLHNTEPTPNAKAVTKQEKQQTNKARLRLQQAMQEQQQNHRMLSPPSFHACGEGRSLVITEHMLSVPLDRSIPTSSRPPQIDLYFSIVERVTDENRAWLLELGSSSSSSLSSSPQQQQRAKDYIQRSGLVNADDMALYLQGGPGFGSPTPMVSLGFSSGSSWAASALDHYGRVVLMDQRGTGR